MSITAAEAQALTIEFTRAYPGARALAYFFRDDVEALYGSEAHDIPASFLGGYVPRPVTHAGRTYDGRVDVPLQNVTDEAHFLETLRHEVLGHYGANTFAPAEKRALLDGLQQSQNEPSLKPLWDNINLRYADKSLDIRAEEVFALHAESIDLKQQRLATEPVQPHAQQAFFETCIARVRLMTLADLHSIGVSVAQGLHDRSRAQQTFPVLAAPQFRADDVPAQTLTLAEFAAQATVTRLVNHGRRWEVIYAGKGVGFSDANTEQGAIRDMHHAAVSNALHLHSPAGRSLSLPTPTFPSPKALADYPDLIATFYDTVPPPDVLAKYPELANMFPAVAQQARKYLAVPYEERQDASAAGARWDKEAKAWYAVGADPDMTKFQRWLPSDAPALQQTTAFSLREEFTAAMREAGLFVGSNKQGDHPIMNGQKHRVPVEGGKKGALDGYYVVHTDGRPAGRIINYKTGVDVAWKSEGHALTDEERAHLRAVAAQNKAQNEVAERQKHIAAAARVVGQIERLKPVTVPTPYLRAKDVKAYTVFTNSAGKTTYVPAHDVNGRFWTMQYIQPDGTKRFIRDGQKEGHFHALGGYYALAAAPVLVIAEGYATAATVAEAIGQPTVAAFDAGNLLPVALALHARYPDKPIVIAGDDDRHMLMTHGLNPGREKADAAARAVGGITIYPQFTEREQYPSTLPAITPESYKAHLQAAQRLDDAAAGKSELSVNETVQCNAALLDAAQLAALDVMKSATDWNDASRLFGKEVIAQRIGAVVGQILALEGLAEQHAEKEEAARGQAKSVVPQEARATAGQGIQIKSTRADALREGDLIVTRKGDISASIDRVSDVRYTQDGKVAVDINDSTGTTIYDERDRVFLASAIDADRAALRAALDSATAEPRIETEALVIDMIEPAQPAASPVIPEATNALVTDTTGPAQPAAATVIPKATEALVIDMIEPAQLAASPVISESTPMKETQPFHIVDFGNNRLESFNNLHDAMRAFVDGPDPTTLQGESLILPGMRVSVDDPGSTPPRNLVMYNNGQEFQLIGHGWEEDGSNHVHTYGRIDRPFLGELKDYHEVLNQPDASPEQVKAAEDKAIEAVNAYPEKTRWFDAEIKPLLEESDRKRRANPEQNLARVQALEKFHIVDSDNKYLRSFDNLPDAMRAFIDDAVETHYLVMKDGTQLFSLIGYDGDDYTYGQINRPFLSELRDYHEVLNRPDASPEQIKAAEDKAIEAVNAYPAKTRLQVSAVAPEDLARVSKVRSADSAAARKQLGLGVASEIAEAPEINIIEEQPETIAKTETVPPSRLSSAIQQQEQAGSAVEQRRIERQQQAAREAVATGSTAEQQRIERQAELMGQVHNMFHVHGAKFYFKDASLKHTVAFHDKGTRVVSASNDDRVSLAMVTMAEAKGWGTVRVSGHPDFCKKVWVEASLRGIVVRGFSPTEHDLRELEASRDKQAKNIVEGVIDKARQPASTPVVGQQPAWSDKAKIVLAVAAEVLHEKVPDAQQRDTIMQAISERLALRQKANKVPSVPMYDVQASSTARQPITRTMQQERSAVRSR